MSTVEVSTSVGPWMTAVGEISRAVNAGEPLEVLLTLIAERVCALIGFDHCAVMLADDDQAHLHAVGWSGLSDAYVALVSDGAALPVRPTGPHGDSPAAQAFREGRSVAVPDVGVADDYGRMRSLAPTQGYRALLAAPLRTARSGLAGVVVAYSTQARAFSALEIELIELLADQAALALETSGLRADQQSVIRELSLANAELRTGRAAIERAEQQHRDLMAMVLADVGLDRIVGGLAQALDASVTVEDSDGGLLALAPAVGYHPPPDAAARRRGPTRAALDVLSRQFEVVHVPGSGGNSKAWVAPVVLGGELAGRLWITDRRAAPEPFERRLIERFALVVGIELLRQRHLRDVERRLSGDLLGDLLRPGGPTHEQGLLDRAAALGNDLRLPHVVAVLAPEPPQRVSRLGELVRAGVDGPALDGWYEDVHVVVLPLKPDPMDALRRVSALVEQALPGLVVATAVGGFTTVAELPTVFRVARGAARLRRAHRRTGVVDVRDLGLSALMLETGAPDTLRRFAQDLLHPVVAHDAQRGGCLLPTLRAWLERGFSIQATAAALVVHPNTVTYRLSRIEQLTGRELRLPDVRLELQLALTVHDIIWLAD
ncbi:MAG TPA: helix-turn-helix domain-containing protein [Pseudonocardia sp.]|nr:helix-turn-helix domain-containing protein [Pseudonocardia sp.]